MKEIDKSWSGVVDAVQDDAEAAKDLALKLLLEYTASEEEIKRLESLLAAEKSKRASSLAALQYIGKIMKLPWQNFIVVTPSVIYEVGTNAVTAKSNVLL